MLHWQIMVTILYLLDKASAKLTDYRPKQEFLCRNFTEGNLRHQEFYSPNYPNTYPSKTECLLVLKADFGYFVRVDFRDQFDIEPSGNCDHDFLEVRDGGHGYSPLIGRFCGRNFPPIITSSDRYLWLRFSSDETIEYSGFRAVYQYIPNAAVDRPDHGPCRYDLEGYEGILGTKDITAEMRNYTRTYDVPIDCTWVITVQLGYKVQLTFPDYKLAEPNECDVNFLDIFGATTDLRNRIKRFCGSVVDTVNSKTNVLHVRFYAEPRALKSKFEAIFTAYRELEGKCYPDEFDCEDATCIPIALRCNGRLNCKFRWDEEGCTKKKANWLNLASKDLIIIMVIGILLVLGICGACLYNCVSKLRQDHKVYKARRSRSREDRLDDVTRSILESPRSLPPNTPSTYKANGHASSEKGITNGEITYLPADVEYDVDDESDAHVDMVDCEVQTRESLFRDSGRTSNSSDAQRSGWLPNLMRSTEPPRSGWAPTPLRSAFFPVQRSPPQRYGPQRDDFRAEAVIEMSEQSKGRADVLAKM